MRWYTYSLKVAGRESINFLRLQALENIEVFISSERNKAERVVSKVLSDKTEIGCHTWGGLKEKYNVMAGDGSIFKQTKHYQSLHPEDKKTVDQCMED